MKKSKKLILSFFILLLCFQNSFSMKKVMGSLAKGVNIKRFYATFVKSKFNEGKVHLSSVLRLVTEFDNSVMESKTGYPEYGFSSRRRLFDYIVEDFPLNTYSFDSDGNLFLVFPLIGQCFSDMYPGLDECIKKGFEVLDENCTTEKLLQYIGENYFKISEGKRIDNDAYYLEIDSKKLLFETLKKWHEINSKEECKKLDDYFEKLEKELLEDQLGKSEKEIEV